MKRKLINKNKLGFCRITNLRFYYLAFIGYMLAGKTLLSYTNFVSPDDYKKNDQNNI